MKRTFLGLFLPLLALLAGIPLATCSTMERRQPPSRTEECVVLLHGLGRTSDSMEKLEEALRKAGYDTANIDYPSRAATVEELAEQAVPRGIRKCRARSARRIHFVTHSMGGILLRYYLAHHPLEELGRVVMLSPPNRGSEIVDRLRDNTFYRWVNGPAGQELGTGPGSLPRRLGAVDYPVGIITGNRNAFWDRWFSNLIPGEDDGKVAVESARLEGMRDFLVVPYSHTFIMQQEEVIGQTLHFLQSGRFRHPSSAASPPP